VAAILALAAAGCVDTPSESARAGWAGAPIDADPAAIQEGKQIAERQCATCHAIGNRGGSLNPAAPPLRDVLALYETDNLAYRFIEGMRVGHDDMPLFDFDVKTADTLLAYIGSLGSRD
jgi:mono/diheme cytochrome c family protein